MRVTIALAVIVAAMPALADEPAPTWRLVTEEAGWQPRDSQGEVVFNDRLWIFGGWFNSYEAPPRDVWSSADGAEWTQVTAEAPWLHSDLAMALAFHDRMWLMGGWYNGRLPGHSASNAVWSSQDGSTWELVNPDAGWSPRLAAGAVVFKDRMWVLGGTEDYYFGDASSLRNDVWSTADGRHWEHVADAPWSPRAYLQAVALGGKMFVIGGGNYVPEYEARNDVWTSEDGVNWTQLTAAAPWHPRLWFSAAAYRGRIWVLGGWSNNPSTNWGDVWYSADGATWTELNTETCWKERHEHSVFVFQDKLWVAGGHAQPLSSEVWSLELPEDWGGAVVK
jgi:hypothetical protein